MFGLALTQFAGKLGVAKGLSFALHASTWDNGILYKPAIPVPVPSNLVK